MVGVLGQGDRAAARETAAAFVPGLAAVVGGEERRAPIESEEDGGADRVDVHQVGGRPVRHELERSRAVGHRAALLDPGQLVLVPACAELDQVEAVGTLREHDQRPRHGIGSRPERSPWTSAVARWAEDTGPCPARREAT